MFIINKTKLTHGMTHTNKCKLLDNLLRFIPLLFIFLVIFFHISYGEESNFSLTKTQLKEIYESRKIQLEFLLQDSLETDSLIFYMIREAEYFNDVEEYSFAIEILDQVISTINDPKNPFEDNLNITTCTDSTNVLINTLTTNPNIWNWSVEVGSDYSKQEYELNYIESDSVVIEELNNPYIALRSAHIYHFNKYSSQIIGYFRLDQELFLPSISATIENTDFLNQWRVEMQSNIYFQFDQKIGNFWENQLRGYLNHTINNQNRFYINSQIRYKYHFSSDTLYGDIFFGDVNMAYRYYVKFLSWIELNLRPSIYNETRSLGLKYLQSHIGVDFNHRAEYNKFIQFRLNIYLRDFINKQLTNDYSNKYLSFIPTLEFEFPIFSPIGIESRLNYESRQYQKPDLTYSNFNLGSLNLLLKYYISTFNSIGVGYIYEIEVHSSPSSEDNILVKQENYNASGMIISLDILGTGGLMLNFGYQYTLRNYPNTIDNEFISFYNNRRVQVIYGIGYIPISPRWQIQFLVNYDNDQDRDREMNDQSYTIFNLSLLYKF
jgi:hypothetical protein